MPNAALMKSSGQRSFFIVTAERPSRSTFTSHSLATALKRLEVAKIAANYHEKPQKSAVLGTS
ncbi:hypothetical protein [Sphingobium sp.]|uniref:hypothetical protein n=1 Tax=Sphingobium sp. TaxID=1912891 RepID=UPI003BB72358